jgi:glutamate-1-semialdehyde 2,1-aminomutase
MAHFDRAKVGDDKFLMQVGTLSGNPIAAAAGLATLEVLRQPGAYEGVFALGRSLMAGLTARIQAAGIAAQVVGEPVLFDVVYAGGEIANYRDMQRANAGQQAHVNRHMRAAGILKGDSKYYMSLAHTPEDVAHTLDAFEAALASLPR